AEDDLRLRPNRKPLIIGAGIVVIGVAVLIAMTIDGSGSNVNTGDGGTTAVVPQTGTAPVPPGPLPVIDAPVAIEDPNPAEEQSISIKVDSDPPGADVMLNGKVIGMTPLDRKWPKGTGSAYITVHKTKYEDVQTRLDMSGDFETKVTLKKIETPED